MKTYLGFANFNVLLLWTCAALIECLPPNLSARYNSSNNNNNSSLITQNNSTLVTSEDIKRPDHLQGVKIERDGHINPDFRKEVLVGKADFKKKATSPELLLASIFSRADKNHDKQLSEGELANWMAKKVKEHLDQAIKENVFIFMAIDKDRNGIVSWEEYHLQFMKDQGFNESYSKLHKENHKDLTRKMREEILIDKAAFTEAARTNPDGLNIDEFLSFRHPEHSHVTLLNMVQDIFDKLDENSDDALSENEFMAVSQDDIPNKRIKIPEHAWKAERQIEFRKFIDTNNDGKVTPQELMMYADPRNPAHAVTEAKNLISLADSDHNGSLSLEEVLEHKDLFWGSKMVDIARTFHDEF